MSIKHIFHDVADFLMSCNKNRKINIEAANLNIPLETVDTEIDMFRAKHETLIDFVQKQTSETSLFFSEQLADNFEQKGGIEPWGGYFELIQKTAEQVNASSGDKENFLSQLSYRTNLLQEYYETKNEDMQHLLDLTCSKHDVYNLCGRNEKALDIIARNQQADINVKAPTPN